MSMNLSCKLDDLQQGNRYMETSVALCEIRTQLQELTKSVESCHNEVSEVRHYQTRRNVDLMFYLFSSSPPPFQFNPLQVKRDMVMIKHELDTVQQVKEEIEELREYVDRLEEHTHRRKLRLLEQVCGKIFSIFSYYFFSHSLFLCSLHVWIKKIVLFRKNSLSFFLIFYRFLYINYVTFLNFCW